MKNKKLLLPAIILTVAVLLMVAYSLISSISKKPTITEKEFPFSITYEFNGKTEKIEDVFKVTFKGHDGYADTKSRIYVGDFVNGPKENDRFYVLLENDSERIIIDTNFFADYMMGEQDCGYFDDGAFEPQILYYDSEEIEYTDEQTLSEHGVKLIDWEYPEPIENTFVFSHISMLSGEVVLPLVLIALLALLAIVIFVKKDKEIKYKPVDIVSFVLNFVVAFTTIPYMTIYGCFSDINGGSSNFAHQTAYLVPAFSILCLASSIFLRRKGFSKSGLIIQFVGPAVFITLIVYMYIFVF